METQAITLKIQYQQEFRRWPSTLTDFNIVVKKIAETFALQIGSFIIKYQDDENDLITITDNMEFVDAINHCQKNVLRLIIYEIDSSTSMETNSSQSQKNLIVFST